MHWEELQLMLIAASVAGTSSVIAAPISIDSFGTPAQGNSIPQGFLRGVAAAKFANGMF